MIVQCPVGQVTVPGVTPKRTAEHFNISRLKIKFHRTQDGEYYDANIMKT